MASNELGMGPSDKDDILLDVIIQGLTKMVKGEKK